MRAIFNFFRKLFGRTFGVSTGVDERNRQYPATTLIPEGAKARTKFWACPIVLNQGRHAACTGFAVCHDAAAEPVKRTHITNQLAQKLYKEAQKVDEWPGEDYAGSSVNAAMRVAQSWGWYGEYRWAFGIEDLMMSLGYLGPAVLQIPWYQGMEKPVGAYIEPTGKLVGRHAIVCLGYDIQRDAFLVRNSWGSRWGNGGDAWITYGDLKALLRDRGSACIPMSRMGDDEG